MLLWTELHSWNSDVEALISNVVAFADEASGLDEVMRVGPSQESMSVW